MKKYKSLNLPKLNLGLGKYELENLENGYYSWGMPIRLDTLEKSRSKKTYQGNKF